jgi:two-component system, chemotaxis family, sensor kinase CheA
METQSSLYKINFRPDQNYFLTGNSLETLFAELQGLGFCRISAHTELIPALDAIDPEASYISWEILLATDKGLSTIRDVFLFVEDISEIHIATLIEKIDHADLPSQERQGEILIEHGETLAGGVMQALARQRPLGEMLVDARLVSRSQVASALAEQEELKRRAFTAVQSKASIRVGSEKLDKLINLVGELVVTQSRLSQLCADQVQSEILEPVREVERLTAELRDCVLNIRMLPIGAIFGKLSRLVRDLSAEQQKEVELITQGAETELDKHIIEKLREPLAHLIRCCIHFGLETPAEREAVGKPRRGSIRLAAVHSGANVVVSIQEDGRGIDLEKIRNHALATGLIKTGDELSDHEIFNLIFTPGFTLAEQATSISGHSLGMDIVRTAVEIMKGSVEVTSEQGRGTTFTLSLPLTLEIIDGLLVRVADISFILPVTVLEEIVELSGSEIERHRGRRILPVRGALVPYVRLRDFFRLDSRRPEREQVVIVRVNNQRIGLVLDDVIGGHQTVIKPLGLIYRHAKGLSGSTILGSGEVALIIDVPQLVYQARMEEAAKANDQRESGARRKAMPRHQLERRDGVRPKSQAGPGNPGSGSGV